ncbi:MAG: toll/interleukin-1 receptor domain-containing protein [Chloroflexi bacterium]|nr:toll/interleukin-1 receptor domain-containing protein [Chloroflexota bacterium]
MPFEASAFISQMSHREAVDFLVKWSILEQAGICEGRRMMGKRRLKVFISYAHIDQVRAYDLYKRLSRDGINAWIDTVDLLPGQERELKVEKAIRDADIVLACHSKHFTKAGFQQKEMKIAHDVSAEKPKGEIFIIPVRFEECDLLDDLKHLHYVDLFLGPLVIDYTYTSYESLLASLRIRARDVGASLPVMRSRPPKILAKTKKEKPIHDFLLKTWLTRHGMNVSPFGRPDLSSYPFYPEGATRPDIWEIFTAPIPLFAQCPTMEDAQALAYLLKRDHTIFPVWIWPQQKASVQSPLLTLVYSAARTWLEILSSQPQVVLNLPYENRKALFELLNWSLGSNAELARFVCSQWFQQNKNVTILLRDIADFEGSFLSTEMPQDSVLLSWMNIRPSGITKTNLLLLGDDLFYFLPTSWFEQFASLIPVLSLNGIDAKFFASFFPIGSLPIGKVELIWSEQWLKRSLEHQFDAALHPEQKTIGVAIRFNELFGPGGTEWETTDKLISSSKNSLARMLNLGNRLLQYHCEKRGVFEKYLYIEDLETILKSA